MVLRRSALAILAGAFVLSSCTVDDSAKVPPGVLDVVVSFYPLAYVVQRVGGPYVHVTDLTPAGTEPHDLELSAQDIGHLEQADLVVYLKGFSPAVDDAVATAAEDHADDVTEAADIDLDFGDSTAKDPHFWLDPTRLTAVAEQVADRLGKLHPEDSAAFDANVKSLAADLATLDAELGAGLATCRSRDLVTSHTAFGYLAARFDLHQIGITGLSPEEEPTPADLARVTSYVKAHDVRTVYSETLVSGDIARTVAGETGAQVAVLDPIESLSAGSGGDYLSIMRVDLATLREGQGCT